MGTDGHVGGDIQISTSLQALLDTQTFDKKVTGLVIFNTRKLRKDTNIRIMRTRIMTQGMSMLQNYT